MSECKVLRSQLTNCDHVANIDYIFLFVKPLRYVLSDPPNLRIWLQMKICFGLHCIRCKPMKKKV